jgi:hypothetical protein
MNARHVRLQLHLMVTLRKGWAGLTRCRGERRDEISSGMIIRG